MTEPVRDPNSANGKLPKDGWTQGRTGYSAIAFFIQHQEKVRGVVRYRSGLKGGQALSQELDKGKAGSVWELVGIVLIFLFAWAVTALQYGING